MSSVFNQTQMMKSFWLVLEDAAKEKDLSLDEASKKAYANEKPGITGP